MAKQIKDNDSITLLGIKGCLDQHMIDNRNDFSMIHQEQQAIKQELKEIKPYITYISDQMKKSEAYKLVGKDIIAKGKGVKWWAGMIGASIIVIGFLYEVSELIGQLVKHYK